MKIITDYPPNIERIKLAFTLHKGIVFTYGDTLYNPDNSPYIDKALMVHEETHMRQQEKIGVENWWNLYITSTDFRISQEVEAYQNQYREQKKHIKDRNKLDWYVRVLARDLASLMYGNVMTMSQALQVIKGELVHFDMSEVINSFT